MIRLIEGPAPHIRRWGFHFTPVSCTREEDKYAFLSNKIVLMMIVYPSTKGQIMNNICFVFTYK